MKKLFRTFIALAVIGSIATLASCTKTCDEGYEGDKCDVKIISKYTGTYSASGTDNDGGTYTNWTVIVSESSTDVLTILINLQNAGITLNAKVAAEGGSYTIANQNISGFNYTGSGTLTSNAMTLTMTEVDGGGDAVIYNFTGTKQ